MCRLLMESWAASIVEQMTSLLFGAVHVNAPPAAYVSLALDMNRLRRLPGYLAVGQFSDPPVLSDLAGFTLEADDIKRLRQCRAGRCAMQLPAEAMRELQGAVDWSAADAGAQANDAVRRMTLALVRRYQEGGNSALGTYADKGRPFQVAEQFALLLSRSEPLPLSRPELNRYLLDYPGATLTNVESLFYWEDRSAVNLLIPQLKESGAEDILELAISKIVP